MLGNIQCHVKIYAYPDWRRRFAGMFRNTFLARSRVAREWEALERLAAAGLQPDLRIARGERRTLGFLSEAFLITRSVAAPDLEHWARAAGPERLASLEPHLWAWVDSLHRLGHRDRNLDPRNILVLADQGGIRFIKIDSPRSFTVRPGDRSDRWRERDRGRLSLGLLALRRQAPRSPTPG
jgi:hypothetical protein